jgi:hypothetical protein
VCWEGEVNEEHTDGSRKGQNPAISGFQALANQVVRKGVCGDFILCGLSPPVSASWSLVHRYTLLTTRGCTRILGCTRSRPRRKHTASSRANCSLTLYRNLQIPGWSIGRKSNSDERQTRLGLVRRETSTFRNALANCFRVFDGSLHDRNQGDPEQRDCCERELQRDPPQVNVALRTELGRARGEHARCEIQTLLSSEEQSLHDGTESQGRKIAQRHRRYQAHCE